MNKATHSSELFDALPEGHPGSLAAMRELESHFDVARYNQHVGSPYRRFHVLDQTRRLMAAAPEASQPTAQNIVKRVGEYERFNTKAYENSVKRNEPTDTPFAERQRNRSRYQDAGWVNRPSVSDKALNMMGSICIRVETLRGAISTGASSGKLIEAMHAQRAMEGKNHFPHMTALAERLDAMHAAGVLAKSLRGANYIHQHLKYMDPSQAMTPSHAEFAEEVHKAIATYRAQVKPEALGPEAVALFAAAESPRVTKEAVKPLWQFLEAQHEGYYSFLKQHYGGLLREAVTNDIATIDQDIAEHGVGKLQHPLEVRSPLADIAYRVRWCDLAVAANRRLKSEFPSRQSSFSR